MDTQDRRQHVRRPLIAQAHLVGPGGAPIPCVLQNISEGGAMLHFEEPCDLPRFFTFQISGNIAVTRRCELRWRDGAFAGVRFVCRMKRVRRMAEAA